MSGTVIIAQGAETQAGVDALVSLGVPMAERCFMGQGYPFGRPASLRP
jgi:EAL domain-containing protein (putative c-di-GMP-specific phosphodiesterase class I)